MHHIVHYEVAKYLTIQQRITTFGCVNNEWYENVWNNLRDTMSEELLDVVPSLLHKFIEYNVYDLKSSNYGFIYACKYGNIRAVKMLLEYGIDPSCGDNHGILMASYYGHVDVVKLLLTYKCVSPTNSAIEWASIKGNINIIKLLLVHKSCNTTRCLTNAIKCGHIDIVKMLLIDYKMDPNVITSNCIAVALQYDHFEMVNYLLNNYNIILQCNNMQCPVDEACIKNNISMVKLLFQHGGRIHTCSRALSAVCMDGNINMLKFILENDIDKVCYDQPRLDHCIFDAYRHNHINIVKLLLPHSDMPLDELCGVL